MTQASDLAVVKEHVMRLLRLVEGNGKIGLVEQANKNATRIDTLSASLDVHLDEHKKLHELNSAAEKERKEFWNKITVGAVLLMLTNIGAIITSIIEIFRTGIIKP